MKSEGLFFPGHGRIPRLFPVLLLSGVAGLLTWWGWPAGTRCRVLLPDGIILEAPRTWSFEVPSAAHAEDRPSRLDLRDLAPPVSASRVPIGPPQRRLDSLQLLEITAPSRNALVAIFYDAHLDFAAIHGGLDLPGAARTLQEIYRQQVLEAHQGTAFRFEWDPPAVSYRHGRTVYEQTYRRFPPEDATDAAPAEYHVRVVVRQNAAIRIESKRTPEEMEDPQIAIDVKKLWASVRQDE